MIPPKSAFSSPQGLGHQHTVRPVTSAGGWASLRPWLWAAAGSGNSELRPPRSPSSPSLGIGRFSDPQAPRRWETEISLAATGRAQGPAWEAGLGTHCCGEFVSAQAAAAHAAGRSPRSKPAACPARGSTCPAAPLTLI